MLVGSLVRFPGMTTYVESPFKLSVPPVIVVTGQNVSHRKYYKYVPCLFLFLPRSYHSPLRNE